MMYAQQYNIILLQKNKIQIITCVDDVIYSVNAGSIRGVKHYLPGLSYDSYMCAIILCAFVYRTIVDIAG